MAVQTDETLQPTIGPLTELWQTDPDGTDSDSVRRLDGDGRYTRTRRKEGNAIMKDLVAILACSLVFGCSTYRPTSQLAQHVVIVNKEGRLLMSDGKETLLD